MPNINIQVAEKIATNMSPGVAIVCGNSDYSISFTFDEEWERLPTKTARFRWITPTGPQFADVVFGGTTVAVPVLSDIQEVMVGVYGGNLQATTPARIPCEYSVRCML